MVDIAEFKPIVVDGKISDVAVVNRGREYNSSPEIKVISTGLWSRCCC